MTRSLVTFSLVFLMILSFTASVVSTPQTLTKCKIQRGTSQSNPRSLTGSVLSKSSKEYKVKFTSNVTKTLALIVRKGQLKLDVYQVDPPKVIARDCKDCKVIFEAGKEYILALSNCSGRTTVSFQLYVTD
jgi:hypothetical protein